MNARWSYLSLFIGVLASAPISAQDKVGSDIMASAPGRIEGASDVLSIGTAATGVVREVLVKEGDHVKKGDVLIEINCKVGEAEVQQRQAEAAVTNVSLTRLSEGARDEEVAIAEAAAKSSEARADEAEKAYQRQLQLAQGVTTQARLEETQRDAKIAADEFVQAKMRLAMLQAGARGEDIIESRAKNQAAIAALNQAVARLDQCTVRAPGDGTILTMYTAAGQFIAATVPTTLLKMVDDSILRVRAEVDERDLQKVCLDQRAKITADGFKGVSLSATVTQVNPAMGRRTILTGDKVEKADSDVRELLLTLGSGEARWPIGLRVLVFFLKC
jgi:HlyD family secretion protein